MGALLSGGAGGEGFDDEAGEPGGIVRRAGESVDVRDEIFGDAADGSGDDGRFDERGFENGQAKGLFAWGVDEAFGVADPIPDDFRRQMKEQADAIGEAHFGDEAFDRFGGIAAAADEHEMKIGESAEHLSEGLEEHVVAFLVDEGGDGDEIGCGELARADGKRRAGNAVPDGGDAGARAELFDFGGEGVGAGDDEVGGAADPGVKLAVEPGRAADGGDIGAVSREDERGQEAEAAQEGEREDFGTEVVGVDDGGVAGEAAEAEQIAGQGEEKSGKATESGEGSGQFDPQLAGVRFLPTGDDDGGVELAAHGFGKAEDDAVDTGAGLDAPRDKKR